MAKTNFASRLGMILATAGSAVGLGNIWRFPTTTGENGGAAFILFYVLCIVLFGLPGMLSEFIVGRSGGCNSFRSYAKAGGRKAWGLIGAMGMLCSSIILGFYSVVAGWCCYYFWQAVCDNLSGDKAFYSEQFAALVARPWISIATGVAVILFTHAIVIMGVQKGLERASKLMMPLLFILLAALIVASCSLPGAWAGIEFLFKPDFSKLNSDIMYEAIGQCFFSLSLGTACLCTYAAYFQKDANILKSSAQIAGIDCGVAIMAGLMIFPAAFAVGLRPDAGPSLLFQTLPYVFQQAFPAAVAYVVSIVFFLLLVLAAVTSTISMHEIGTSLLSEELRTTRKRAAVIISLFCVVICILSAWSMGPSQAGFFGKPLFDNFDALTSNILLPLGAFLTALLVGWRMPKDLILAELTSEGRFPWARWAFMVFLFLVRFVTPTGIAIIILDKFNVI